MRIFKKLESESFHFQNSSAQAHEKRLTVADTHFISYELLIFLRRSRGTETLVKLINCCGAEQEQCAGCSFSRLTYLVNLADALDLQVQQQNKLSLMSMI